MRRIGGPLFLVLLAACGPAGGETATPAVVTTTTAAPTTTTSTSTSTTSTTSTTLARPTTTATRATATVPTTVALARPVPAATTTAPATAGGCDPNYAGACVPIDSDVDCGGGSGNGPSYVYAKNFRVVAHDVYGLDSDNDGIACER